MSDTQCTQKGQLVVVAHDLKPLATPKGGLLGHFTARRPAWDAQLRFCRWARDCNGSIRIPPLQYRWRSPEGEERYAPVVIFRSLGIERAFLVTALRAVQTLANPGSAP
jgi:hypothetical protein